LRISIFAILQNRKDEISPRMSDLIIGLCEDWLRLDERIEIITGEIEMISKGEENCDRLVRKNQEAWEGEITHDARGELAGMMAYPIATDEGETDLYRAMTLVVNGLAKLFEGEAKKLYLPKEIAFVNTPRLPRMDD
jgi:hypothetical protein